MADYDLFSRCYDQFTEDVDYAFRVKRLLELFEKYDRKPTLLLDLACGTGNFSFPLAKAGIDVIGVDCSEGMLAAAMAKLPEGCTNPLFLNQYAEELELYGTVDAVVCALDSLNYLRNTKELQKVFSLVNNYLYPGGVFLFDMNTPYKFENIYADNSYVLEDEGIYCGWQNEYNSKTKLCRFYLSVFEECEDGSYLRTDEVQTERCFSLTSIKRALSSAGLEMCGIYGDTDFSLARNDSERWYFAARKNK